MWEDPLMRAAFLSLALTSLSLGAQETPRPNRVAWLEVFPEPLPEGVPQVALEMTSQFLRPDFEESGDGRTSARLDGEEWQFTGDLPFRLGPGILNLRLRIAHRSGGAADQLLQSWHGLLGTDQGGRDLAPKGRLAYFLERDGVIVGRLDRPGLRLMDTDLAFLLPWGDGASGGRLGASLQLPTGRREDFSGSGGLDGTLGLATWKTFGPWRLHGQAERVFIGLPGDSPYRAVLAHRAFNRAWAGFGLQGRGPGFWRGLGLDITLAYAASPYRVDIPRIDRAGWQQHWTFSHARLPAWRLGFSEEAGTYMAPDITAFVSKRF